METKPTADQIVYEDFTPSQEWVQKDGWDVLIVELPEFKKEQFRVHLEKPRKLSITGQRPLAENRWRRFQIELQVPNDYKEFREKFDKGYLYVETLPKFSKPVQVLMNVMRVLKNVLMGCLMNVFLIVFLGVLAYGAYKNQPQK